MLVEALRPVWMRTTVDGVADAGGTLQAGQTKHIDADREVLLRVGDGGALRTSLNGGEPRTLGHDGEVVTRRFGLDEPSAESASDSPIRAGAPAAGDAQRSSGAPHADGTASSSGAPDRSSAGSSSIRTGPEKK